MTRRTRTSSWPSAASGTGWSHRQPPTGPPADRRLAVRATFRAQLDTLRGRLVLMAASATSAMRWANQALLDGDLDAASQVLETADHRLALASLYVAGDIERMGALARHIAKIMLMRHPAPAVPPEAAVVLGRMGQLAERLAWKVTRVLEVGNPQEAVELDRDDDEMDALHRDLFEVLFERRPPGGLPGYRAVTQRMIG